MSTYTSLTYHMVFSTKYRIPRIDASFAEDLYSYIGGITDHIHVLAGLSPTISVSQMLKQLKGNSSKWVNDEKKTKDRFEWQAGYGAFTVSQSQIPAVTQYIRTQAVHHKRLTFEEEFLAMLQRHNIDYDPKYVFRTEHAG